VRLCVRCKPWEKRDLPRRAVTALEAVIFEESALHRVQLIAVCKALDRRDLPPLRHHRDRETRINAPFVDEHREAPQLL
jgi:hypothetical protein